MAHFNWAVCVNKTILGFIVHKEGEDEHAPLHVILMLDVHYSPYLANGLRDRRT